MRFIFLVLLCPSVLHAIESEPLPSRVPFNDLFYEVDDNFIGSFSYNYGLNHLFAIGVTYALVASDIDGRFSRFNKENKIIPYAGMPAVIVGGLTPIALPLGLYFYGANHRDSELQNTGLALGQAAMIGVTISSIYKAVTGRHRPEIIRSTSTADATADWSHDFNFGILKNGIFYGWPSGHATIAFAMGTTVAELYPDNDFIRYGGYAYALIVAAGISTNIHWLSDGVAGSLIGYAIGKTVGRSFSKKVSEARTQTVEWSLSPQTISVRYRF